MFKNIKIIKSYYKLARVKPLLIFLIFITLLIPALLSILNPILLSRAITSITVYDFKRAKQQISYEFIIIIVSAIAYLCYYFANAKCSKIIIYNFQNYIYNNVRQNKNIESISINVIKDINTCAEFNKNLIYKLCFFIKSIIILAIIFHYNKLICLSIIFVSIVSYFLLNINDRKIQYQSGQLSRYELQSLELFNSICKGQKIEQSYNLNSALKDKYFEYVDENIKTKNKISFYYNINNNIISLILKTAIFISTIYLIGLVKSTVLTLSIYLILTPYLTSSAENLISFFDVFSEIALVDNIMQEFESLQYISSPKKEQPIEIKSYNLYFYQVSVKNITNLDNLTLKLSHASIVYFQSENPQKTEAIYNLILKNIKPDSGSIFLDGKNISDIDSITYNSYITSTSKDDQFFHISIYENLYLVCSNRQKIFKTIKILNLKEIIDELPEKIQTIYSDKINKTTRFFLSLLRAYLSGAKIINIISCPDSLNKEDYLILTSILQTIKKHTLVIFYFKNDKILQITDTVINLDKNE